MPKFSTLLAFLFFSVPAIKAQDHKLKLQTGTLNTLHNTAAFAAAEEPGDVVAGYYYRILQFSSTPSREQRANLEAGGLILMDYIPDHAYITAIPERYNRRQLADLGVFSVVQLLSTQKIHRNLLGGFPDYCLKEQGMADVTVQYMRNIPAAKARELAAAKGWIMASLPANHTFTLRIPEQSLYSLAAENWVLFISAVSAPSFPEDTKGRSLHRVNAINTADGYASGRKYDGEGVAAALADDGYVGPHIDFTGRLVNYINTTGATHGDMTSGILAGAGNLNPEYRGMGSGASLYVFDINGYPHILNAVSNYDTINTVITSTSYSQGCNDYTTDTQFGDDLLNNNRQLMFVFSAGNNQAGDCSYGAGPGWGVITGGYKQGKNVIAVANLDALEVLDATSSRGPASDGRVKPDISSNGKDQMSTDENNTYQAGGGTSAACPGIAGILTELYQAYKELNGGNEPQGSLMKACLLNSAEDIGNPGPDFTYGWGRVNALRALQTIEENRYLHDSVAQGQTNTHTITVPAGVSELKVMVYWNDVAGSPLVSSQLVNDIDITLDSSGTAISPWILDPTPTVAAITSPAIRGTDRLNNMEQVTLKNPVAGTYTLSVNGYSISSASQDYFVVYEFRTNAITLTYPFGGESFVPGRPEVIRWDATKGQGPFTLEYSSDAGASWTTISSNINQNNLQYSWSVPGTFTPSGQVLLRVSRGSDSDVSDTTLCIVGIPTNLQVGWACPDSIQLNWNNVNGATGYTIYKLGNKYMDVAGTSSTNSIVLYNNNVNDDQWFSVSAQVNGASGRRANAIHKLPGLVNCVLNVDAALTTLVSPFQSIYRDCRDNSAVPVTITINNTGITPLTNIPVSYLFANTTPVNEIIAGPVAPGTQLTYTFTTTLNLSVAGTYSLLVWSNYSGDQNLGNDTLHSTVNVSSSPLQVFPTSEDFEALANCITTADCNVTTCATGLKWQNEANGVADDIDFRVNNGSTASAGTGPDVDHTTQTANGKYIYLEASGSCNQQTALLTAPCVDLTGTVNPLLSFWYHMYGATMGSLTVEVLGNNGWTTVFPTVSGNQGNAWLQGTADLTSFAGQIIDVRFSAVTGTDFTSDLALDDISINLGASTAEHSAYADVRVYPNPSTGIFTIALGKNQQEIKTLEISDVTGRIIRTENTIQGTEYLLNLRNENKGIYLLTLKGEQGSRVIRLTVM